MDPISSYLNAASYGGFDENKILDRGIDIKSESSPKLSYDQISKSAQEKELFAEVS